MLKEVLLSLAMLLSKGGGETRAKRAIDAIENVTSGFDATTLYPDLADKPQLAKEKLSKLLISWSYWESSWHHDALGDAGKSCGIMQVMPRSSGVSCEQMRSSPEEGYRAGLNVIKRLNKICGGLKPALGAYGSGKCGGIPKIVEDRCKKSGGC